eukprot:TRINITY_DN175_c0_g1_i1.p1 TRINITY_DN175_c0_g1~~TRINITY_DN175_c0_g1_i1.p1  ORF type:complete len:236 (-),score=86.16 TRINITY_DN175_c0_g1_i1:71-778(-)
MFDKRGFYDAAREGNCAALQMMLDAGQTTIDAKDGDERTAFHWAAAGGQLEVVKFLIKRGAKTDEEDDSGWSPLMSAVSSANSEVVKVILESGTPDVNRKNETGRSVLHYACSKGNESIVQMLLEKGAKVNVSDSHGNTPLHGVCGNAKASQASREKMLELILKKVNNVDCVNSGKETPLHIAVIEDHRSLSLKLVEAGANVLLEQDEGKNALELSNPEFRQVLLEAARKMDKQT